MRPGEGQEHAPDQGSEAWPHDRITVVTDGEGRELLAQRGELFIPMQGDEGAGWGRKSLTGRAWIV
jgi:hypothetical protein